VRPLLRDDLLEGTEGSENGQHGGEIILSTPSPSRRLLALGLEDSFVFSFPRLLLLMISFMPLHCWEGVPTFPLAMAHVLVVNPADR
jgi:hypothetical protein